MEERTMDLQTAARRGRFAPAAGQGQGDSAGGLDGGEPGRYGAQVPQGRGLDEGDMARFLEAYPDVRGSDVPEEVWRQVAEGESLVTAYTMYENRQLKAQLAAQRQNGENARRSVGSLANPRGERMRKTLEDYWDEAAL